MTRRKQPEERKRPDAYSLRLDPALRYAADLAAAKERRTLSSLIEWAVYQALQQVVVATRKEQQLSALEVAKEVWNEDEIVRLILLAERFPMLLTTEQQQLRDLIFKNKNFVVRAQKGSSLAKDFPKVQVNIEEIRRHWSTLKKVASGELPRSALPDGDRLLIDTPVSEGPRTPAKETEKKKNTMRKTT